MPEAIDLQATVRNDKPVAVLILTDVEGVEMTFHLAPHAVLWLNILTAKFNEQIYRGEL